jgi:hypothetical protein
MEPDLAALMLDSLAITVTDLEAADADPYDLEPLTAIPRLFLASRPNSETTNSPASAPPATGWERNGAIDRLNSFMM